MSDEPMFGPGWSAVVEAQLAKRDDLIVRECGGCLAHMTTDCPEDHPLALEATA